MSDPVILDGNLASKNIQRQAAAEYIYGNPFADFISESQTAVIHHERSETKGAGQRIFFSLLEALDPDLMVRGDSQLVGNEQERVLRDDSVVIDYVRTATIIRNHKLLDIRTPIELIDKARPALVASHSESLRNDLIDAAGVTVSPLQSRVRFGALESNYNATLATALATLDTTDDLMNVALIRGVKRKAQDSSGTYSGGVTSRKIRPATVEGDLNSTAYKETYVIFLDFRSADDLKSDTVYQALRDDARQNLISMSFINKSLFVGMIENVLVYEMPELDRIGFPTAGASSANVTHNLFCGAQAWGLGTGMDMEFVDEDFDYKKDKSVAGNVIRGLKVLQYSDDTNDVNAGLIHVMAATTL